ncbi:putative acyltransferase [Sphingobacterium zeae]|uniref:Acyltransferase n=1 Tax=Sphingobacterium zeae TaxID=1776859 RepID=A0ABU0U6U4_9SPHI|nr:heparan-alpha-glucosaminide N-acetyltransferase domain-containing protein [Sphingobacterium zeae]MDQ1150678.1 putative acyltransferase [Sphingobacterium zeae]
MTRFKSLDIFRGFTLAAMILVNNPGNYHHVFPQLEHSIWHGCTFTDLIFPFFLFAVGNSMAFSLKNSDQLAPGLYWNKIVKRTIILFLLGLFLNVFPFVEWNSLHQLEWIPFAKYRYFGVLQRIAICYFSCAMLVYYFKDKGALIVSAVFLLCYWLICYYSNPSDPYSLDGWFGTKLDISMFGASHLYHGEGTAFDPEDIWSVFPAISQTLFGYIAGKYIIQKLRGKRELNVLLLVGLSFIFAGYIWSFFFPLNKKIWTSSYCLFTTGIALSFLCILIYLIEFQKVNRLFYIIFDDFGKNTLLIYCISGLIPTICSFILIGVSQQNLWDFSYNILFGSWQNQQLSSALFALLFVALNWLIAYYLRKKKIYIKI